MIVMLAMLISLVLASVGLVVGKIWNNRRAYLLSLLLISPALITSYDYLTCSVSSLETWYWLNCALPIWMRIITMFTMPSFLIPLSSTIIAILGYIRGSWVHVALAILIEAGLVGYNSIYLGLKYSMLLQPPNIPPVGYSVVRSNFGLLYKLLYILSLTFVLDHFLSRSQRSLIVATVLLSLALPLFFWWSLKAYAAPLPLTFYHLSILLTWLTAISLNHEDTKLEAVGLASAYLTSLCVHRAYPVPIAAMAPPFFGLQSGIAITLAAAIITSLYLKMKAVRNTLSIFSLISFASIFLLVSSLTSLAIRIIMLTAFNKYEYYVAASLLVITSAGVLLPLTKKLKKMSFIAFAGLLNPYLGLAIAFITAFITLRLERRAAFMSFIAILTAVTILYSSTLVASIPLATPSISEIKCVRSNMELYKYMGNVTALSINVRFRLNSSEGYMEIPATSLINVYEGKYIPPNLMPYTVWSGIRPYRILGLCAVSGRSYLGSNLWPSAVCHPLGNFEYKVVCTPLGALAFVVPLIALTCCLKRAQSSS